MTRKHVKSLFGGLAVSIILAAVLVAHFMGISAYVITGASMTGAIPKGSLAIDQNIPVSELKVGDVITFRTPAGDGAVTHRIVEVLKGDSGQPLFRTKGDFNESADPWTFSLDRQVQARNIFHIPYVGYGLAAFTLRWVRTGILVLVGLLILSITLAWVRKNPAEDRRTAEKVTYYKTGELLG